MPTTTRQRKSRFLFDWNFADGLTSTGGIVARTGQVGTFARGGTVNVASALDANARYFFPGYKAPRFHRDPTSGLYGVLLEGARTNPVIQSDALNTGWTLANCSATNAYATHAGRPFSRITGMGAGTEAYRTVTLTGDGVKAFSLLVATDGTAGTFFAGIYDATVATFRARAQITVAASGVVTAAIAEGTLFGVIALADGAYRVLVASTSCTAVNTHRAYGALQAGGALTSVQISGVDVEDASFPSSVIPTTTTTLTRSADALSFAFLYPPGAMTVAADFICNQPSSFDGSFIYEIGTTAGTRLSLAKTSGAATLTGTHSSAAGTVTSAPACVVT